MNEFSNISLSHGDGGEITLQFIRQEILSRFGNPSLNLLEDGSKIDVDNISLVISTDSYIIDPPIFPGGDIGRLAVAGTINDLLACGAITYYLTLSLIITEEFPLATLRQILDSVQETSQSAGVKIVTGDTKVLEKDTNTKTGIYINTTGIGLPLRTDKNYAVSNAQIGDNIIITGSIGDHGLAVLSSREGLGFERRIYSDCAPLQELIIPLLKNIDGIRCLRDPTRGGLTGVLVDIAEASEVDVLVDESVIPIQPEVRFGCEMLGLEPLNLVNEGKMVIVVSSEDTKAAIAQLHQHPLGKESAVIGTVQKPQFLQGKFILKKQQQKYLIPRPKHQIFPRLC